MFFAVFYFILTVSLSFPSNIIQDMSLHSALLFNTPTSILSGSTQQTCNVPSQSAISNKNLNICCTFFLHSTLLFNTSSVLSQDQLSKLTMKLPNMHLFISMLLHISLSSGLHTMLLFIGDYDGLCHLGLPCVLSKTCCYAIIRIYNGLWSSQPSRQPKDVWQGWWVGGQRCSTTSTRCWPGL